MMLAITQEEPSGEGAVLREGEGGVPPGQPPQAQEDLPGHHTGVRYRILIQVSDRIFCKINLNHVPGSEPVRILPVGGQEGCEGGRGENLPLFNVSTFDHMCMSCASVFVCIVIFLFHINFNPYSYHDSFCSENYDSSKHAFSLISSCLIQLLIIRHQFVTMC